MNAVVVTSLSFLGTNSQSRLLVCDHYHLDIPQHSTLRQDLTNKIPAMPAIPAIPAVLTIPAIPAVLTDYSHGAGRRKGKGKVVNDGKGSQRWGCASCWFTKSIFKHLQSSSSIVQRRPHCRPFWHTQEMYQKKGFTRSRTYGTCHKSDTEKYRSHIRSFKSFKSDCKSSSAIYLSLDKIRTKIVRSELNLLKKLRLYSFLTEKWYRLSLIVPPQLSYCLFFFCLCCCFFLPLPLY